MISQISIIDLFIGPQAGYPRGKEEDRGVWGAGGSQVGGSEGRMEPTKGHSQGANTAEHSH